MIAHSKSIPLVHRLYSVTVFVAHEKDEEALFIEQAARMAGANIVDRARSADEAIERVRQQASSRNALVFSHTVKGDICALADVATQCNVRIVISYPAESAPHSVRRLSLHRCALYGAADAIAEA